MTRGRALLVASALGVLACGAAPGGGPPTTSTESSRFASLEERVQFLERYVRFRRRYETLDFRIAFHANGGLVPGPSDWFIGLVARVPVDQLSQWRNGLPPLSGPPEPRAKLPETTLDVSGVREWYGDRRRYVGLDPEHAIVVYVNRSL